AQRRPRAHRHPSRRAARSAVGAVRILRPGSQGRGPDHV
ncbi:MAG: hypothetical protein AVDCRST_MAG24-1043, partial [uncultured Nocardioidaceae bacterium]